MNLLPARQIGRTNLSVTRLGLGGAGLAGLYTQVPEEQAIATVHRSLERGITLFDTAPLYANGLSEFRLGKALAGRDRSSFVLATKVGRVLDPETDGKPEDFWGGIIPQFRPVYDFSYDGTMRSLEESLRRLNLDRIDILHIHDPDNWPVPFLPEQRPETDYYDEAMKGAYRALVKLRSERTIRAAGVGMNQAEMLTRFAREGDFDCFLLAGRYTLIDHSGLKELLPLCEEKQISIIIGGPYNSGILATGAQPGTKFNYLDAPPEILDRVRRIEGICATYNVPLKAAALQFPLAHPAVAAVIPGGRSPEEVEENVRMVSHLIPADFWAELREQRLIPEESPVPSL
jgi:D-threo-aldose 1-dehydrogenase